MMLPSARLRIQLETHSSHAVIGVTSFLLLILLALYILAALAKAHANLVLLNEHMD